MADFILNTLYKEVPSQFIVHKNFVQIPLPTEIVLRLGIISSPIVSQYARAYDTDLYCPFDSTRLLTYHEAVSEFHDTPAFKGGGIRNFADPVKMLEYFEDYGDDGHIEYKIQGWVFVRQDEIKPDLYVGYGSTLVPQLDLLTNH